MDTVQKVIDRWGGNPFGQHAHVKDREDFKKCKPQNMLYHFGIQVTLAELHYREKQQDYEWCQIVISEIKEHNRLYKKHLPLKVEETIAD